MKFAIINRGDENSKKVQSYIEEKLRLKGLIYDENSPDYLITIGGDGTFLLAVNKYYRNEKIVFISVNTGSFGYLCEFEVEEIDNLINNLGNFPRREISLLKCKIKEDKKDEIDPCFMVDTELYALNEFRISSTKGKTLQFDVSINDTFLETLRGDGCVISTSVGSSGVARSMGGALVDNEIEMIQFVENAPILNHKYGSLRSAFVLSKEKVIKLNNFSHEYEIFYDCENVSSINQNTIVEVKLSDKKIRIIANPNKNYIAKTSKSFIR